MVNGKTASLQNVLKKLDSMDSRLRKLERERTLGVERLSDKEMGELRAIRKDMERGKEFSWDEVFGKG